MALGGAVKLRALGKLGEFCSEASVPVITAKGEQVIGFRQLAYVVYRAGLLKKEVLPRTSGWVYLTNRRILMLDDGWVDQGGARLKRYQEVPFMETTWVRHKQADRVWVDVTASDGRYTISYEPYGAAARLFAWLLKEKGIRQKYEAGELEGPYAKDRWYRHPPK